VNAVQREMAIPVDAVRTTYIRIRTGRLELGAASPALVRSSETLAVLERRIKRLKPPADARILHRRLGALDAAQADFAADVALLSTYLPALIRQERALGSAGSRLSSELRRRTDPSAQQEAFQAFSVRVAGVAARIRTLEAPAVMEPARVAEATRTRVLVELANRIGRAIGNADRAEIAVLLNRFGAVAQGGSGGIERGAVIAFNRRARKITDLQIAVETERSRLDRVLG
jgi:hypothetical protein